MGAFHRADTTLCAVKHANVGALADDALHPKPRRNRRPQTAVWKGTSILSAVRGPWASLIDAGLVNELRIIAYPLIAGEGKALFATTERRHRLDLRNVQERQGGRVTLIYGIR